MLIASTSDKYTVKEFDQTDFYDFSTLLKQKYSWKKLNKNGNSFKLLSMIIIILLLNIIFFLFLGEKFEWRKIKWLRYSKNSPGIIQYKESLNENDPFKILNIKRRGVSYTTEFSLKQCYLDVLPISQKKKKDLVDMLPLISPGFHDFYKNLRVEGETTRITEIDEDLEEEEECENE